MDNRHDNFNYSGQEYHDNVEMMVQILELGILKKHLKNGILKKWFERKAGWINTESGHDNVNYGDEEHYDNVEVMVDTV